MVAAGCCSNYHSVPDVADILFDENYCSTAIIIPKARSFSAVTG